MKTTIIECHYCGKDVEKRNWMVKKSRKNNKKMFCNLFCAAKYQWKQRQDNFVMPTEKQCPQCGKTKLLVEFYPDKAKRDNRQSRCKICHNNEGKRWYKKRKYGLTPEGETEILESQDGVCAICGCDPPLCVDHDHVTGYIRGLLCLTCNLALGGFRDSPHNLRRAANYLEKTPRYKIPKGNENG